MISKLKWIVNWNKKWRWIVNWNK